jgi:hypothetical protein
MNNKLFDSQSLLNDVLRSQDITSCPDVTIGDTYEFVVIREVGENNFLVIKYRNKNTERVFSMNKYSFNSFTYNKVPLDQYFDYKLASDENNAIFVAQEFTVVDIASKFLADGMTLDFPLRAYIGYSVYEAGKKANGDKSNPALVSACRLTGLVNPLDKNHNRIIHIDTKLVQVLPNVD